MTNAKSTDNYTRPEDKARFGFSMGSDGQIAVGAQTAGETPEQGGLETVATNPDDKGARNNGGGAEAKDPNAAVGGEGDEVEDGTPEKMTIPELKEALDAADVPYTGVTLKADFVALYHEHIGS